MDCFGESSCVDEKLPERFFDIEAEATDNDSADPDASTARSLKNLTDRIFNTKHFVVLNLLKNILNPRPVDRKYLDCDSSSSSAAGLRWVLIQLIYSDFSQRLR